MIEEHGYSDVLDDERQERSKQQKSKNEADDRKDALRSLLSTRKGRRLIAHWLQLFGLHSESVQDGRDEHEGRRGAALIIWRECREADTSLFARLIQEEMEDGRL